MATFSRIAWTKSTFNPWIGCTKVSPGCDHCYAEVSTPSRTLRVQWGAGNARHRTSEANWRLPEKWNRCAPDTEFAGRKGYWPVFCASLADVFDNEAPKHWRADLWALIERTPNLTWFLVTKRIGNVRRMVPADWMREGFPSNVRVLITIVNEKEAQRDLPKLLALPCHNGVSYEPALGPVDWRPWLTRKHHHERALEWIIIGGESDQPGAKARAFHIAWARHTVDQCRAAGAPPFVKQLGSTRIWPQDILVPPAVQDRAGAEPAEWAPDLRVQEFPA